MKLIAAAVVSTILASASAEKSQNGPVQKIIQLLGDMQTKAIKQGEVEQANFEEMQRWCEKQSWEKHHAIAEEKKQITAAKAQIETADSNTAQLSALVESLSTKISENEKELKEATALRAEQKSSFDAKDKELIETVDTLSRAAKVMRKHMKGGAFLQTNTSASKHLEAVKTALSSIVKASFISLKDKQLIQSLVQSETANKDNDSDNDLSLSLVATSEDQPQASTSNYDSKSGGIVETFENLKEKAEAVRSAGQKDEMNGAHGFAMLEQSTKDEIKALMSEMEEAKKKISRAEETKGTATGNLANVSKDLAADQKYLDDTQRECMNSATDFETAQKARAEEVKVLANAKSILSDAAFVQTAQSMSTESAMSFLQVRSRATARSMIKSKISESSEDQMEKQKEAATYLRKEGKKLQSYVLTQVGVKVESNPFEKVNKMVQGMISKLEKEASGEADQHAWCTSEQSKTSSSLELKQDRLEEMQTRFEQATSNKQQLLDQIKALTSELAAMDKAQSEATALRTKEKNEYSTVSKDLSAGQKACATAIKILKDYYGGGAALVQTETETDSEQPAGSAASGIVGMLETAEADFSRNLAEATTEEDQKQTEFEQYVEDTKVSKAAKNADIKNKNSETKRLGTLINETELDVNDANSEHEAVVAYASKLKKNCETKVPSYEERKKRREEEMAGLKNALDILNGNGVALTQMQNAADDLLKGFN